MGQRDRGGPRRRWPPALDRADRRVAGQRRVRRRHRSGLRRVRPGAVGGRGLAPRAHGRSPLDDPAELGADGRPSSWPRPAPTPTCPATTSSDERPQMPHQPRCRRHQVGEPVEHARGRRKDALLYALGVGAGADRPARRARVHHREHQRRRPSRCCPTMAVVLGGGRRRHGATSATFNPAMLVHGEQAITLHGQIPVEGTVSPSRRDHRHLRQGQGRGRASRSRSPTHVDTGEPLFDTPLSAVHPRRGWLGRRPWPVGPAERAARARRPTTSVTYATRTGPGAASTGSPATATRCTPTRSSPRWPASTGRSCTACAPTASPAGRCCTRCAAATRRRFTSMEGRFSSPVFPGESLTVKMWVDGGEAVFTTETQNGETVIDAGRCRFSRLTTTSSGEP